MVGASFTCDSALKFELLSLVTYQVVHDFHRDVLTGICISKTTSCAALLRRGLAR